MDVYSIPSISAEPEPGVFWSQHTISDERTLKPETIEALECSKSTLRAGIYRLAVDKKIDSPALKSETPSNLIAIYKIATSCAIDDDGNTCKGATILWMHYSLFSNIIS